MAASVILNAKEIKLLNVGNSFSWSLSPYLVRMTEHEGKHKLVHCHCSMGGCELRRHWKYVENFETKGIRDYTWATNADGTPELISLQEALKKDAWDVISVQQASHESWRPDTYQPYGAKLVEYIHQYAPQARIIVQQTWAYRTDDSRLGENGDWHMTQQEMYERLTDAYQRFANEMGLPLVPAGKAVQLARQRQEKKFVNYDKAEAVKLPYPQLPDQSGAFINGHFWTKDAEGKNVMGFDSIHLNARGRYLQALVWYGFLFGEDPATVTYLPEEIDAKDAEFLRGIASEVLKETPKF